MRQIICTDKYCELQAPSQNLSDSQSVNISSAATGGLIAEPSTSTVPISGVNSSKRRKRMKKTAKNPKKLDVHKLELEDDEKKV